MTRRIAPTAAQQPSLGRPSKKQISASEREENFRLIKIVQGHDKAAAAKAMDTLLHRNLGLVHRIAQKCTWSTMGYSDLVQEGSLGLAKGIERFDLKRGTALSTYATWWIRHHIYRAIENYELIRLPARYGQLLGKLRTAMVELPRKLGHQPSHAELAKHLKCPIGDVRRLIERGRITHSLDAAPRDEEDCVMHDAIASDAPTPEESELDRERSALVQEALAQLSPREAKIIRMRFLTKTGSTLQEAGDELELSRERIRQIELPAIEKMQLYIRRRTSGIAKRPFLKG